MTSEEYIRRYKQKINELKASDIVGIAAQDTHSIMIERIFDDNENVTNAQIGKYNTTDPLYVSPITSPKKFPPKGKNGNSKFEDGKLHKTGYFKSYSDYRKSQGRKTDKVDLFMFGNLRSDFSKGVVKINNSEYVSKILRDENIKKKEGAEFRFGKIFSLTPKERTNFKQVMAFEVMQILNAK